jgi:hypothetical protein
MKVRFQVIMPQISPLYRPRNRRNGRDGKNFTSSRKPYPLRSAKVHLSQLPSITRLPGLKLAKMAIFGDFPIESGHMNMLYNQAYGVKWNFHL